MFFTSLMIAFNPDPGLWQSFTSLQCILWESFEITFFCLLNMGMSNIVPSFESLLYMVPKLVLCCYIVYMMYSSHYPFTLEKKRQLYIWWHMQKVKYNTLICASCNQFCFEVIMLDSPKDTLTERATSKLLYLCLRWSLVHLRDCLHLWRKYRHLRSLHSPSYLIIYRHHQW